jgi:subtilisin family serine protease
MKKSLHAALVCSALILSFGLATAYAQESDSLSEAGATAMTGNLWFVELTGAPTADGNSLANVRTEKAAFKKAAATAGIKYKERRSFDVLFNGLSVEISARDAARLKSVSGVKAVWPVNVIQMPPTDQSAGGAAPDLATAIAMTGADIAQNTLLLTGTGVKVAVMDTGIDYDHPDLGGCFGTGCRVAYGYDLVGDAYNADPASPAYNPVPTPDADPDDCGGHGTHVAGIVGANGAVKGVAPGVTFGAYRVFGCAGSTTDDVMISAMEMALADGMQVLNMSIGDAFNAWPQAPTARASDRLVNKGVSVVASIGNSGASGLYSAGAPGVGAKVIGVASFENTQITLPYFTVNSQKVGYIPMQFAGPTPTSGTEEIVYIGRSCNVDSLVANPSGKVALVVRGTCSFNEKATKAIIAGATAVVIYNSAPGVFAGTLGTPINGTTPVVGISQADGLFIRAQAAPIMMTWTSLADRFPNPAAGLISSFSSYGLAADLSLKPDIGAPGGNIYSTYPVELGSYATLSGTSMSSPHVAGGVALMLEAKPNTPSNGMRARLQNSADPKNWFGNPGLGFLDNVHRQGAGMLDIDDAILATTIIEPGKIAAGEGQAGPFAQTLTVTNNGASAVTYDLSYVNALSTGGVITPSFFNSNAGVAFSAPSVAVPAGGSATVNATITPASGPTNGQYGGYIVFTPQGGGQVYRVPFAGFVGDYQGIQVFAVTGFPNVVQMTACSSPAILRGLDCFGETPAFTTFAGPFTMANAFNVPVLRVHLDHQVRTLRAEVFTPGGKAWHRIFDFDYVARNRDSSATSFFAFPWDGKTFAGNKTYTVPDGQYVVKVSILKALGDSANPAHWETWTSPVITIDRP